MKKLLCIVAFFVSTSANAILIDHGDYVEDTASGLDWLKLESTMGLTSSEVKGQLSSGKTFDGWQYATGIEWEHLLFGQGFVAGPCANGGNFCGRLTTTSGDASGGAARRLMRLFGTIPLESSYYPYAISLGMLADIDVDSGEHWVTQLFTDDYGDDDTGWAETFFSTETWQYVEGSPVAGSWLIRSSRIPEPAILSLFILGFAGLWGVRRQAKK